MDEAPPGSSPGIHAEGPPPKIATDLLVPQSGIQSFQALTLALAPPDCQKRNGPPRPREGMCIPGQNRKPEWWRGVAPFPGPMTGSLDGSTSLVIIPRAWLLALTWCECQSPGPQKPISPPGCSVKPGHPPFEETDHEDSSPAGSFDHQARGRGEQD